jgi:hypothetical protein
VHACQVVRPARCFGSETGQGGVRNRRVRAARWAGLLLYARAEWRVRWRSYLLVAGIVAVTVGAVVATLTAAGRSETAFDRLRAATRASDAIAYFDSDFNSSVGTAAAAALVDTVTAVDGVHDAEAQAELFVRPAGSDLFPNYDLYSGAPIAAGADSMNAPVISSGRAIDPTQVDEIAVSEKLAAALGVTAGDTIELESMTDRWINASFNGRDPGPPDGPRLTGKVVGVARTPGDFGKLRGILFMSPAFVAQYGSQLRTYTGAHAQLSDIAARQARDGTVPGLDRDVELGPSAFGDNAATDDGLGTIGSALRIVAAIAALAGAVVIALVLSRLTRLALRDRETLVALGWTTRDSVLAAALVCTPALVTGVGLGLVVGVLASPRAMVGLARAIDPTRGAIVVDERVVFAASAAALVAGLLAVGLAARRGGVRREQRRRATSRPIQLQRPLPLFLGVRHAIAEPEKGGRASWGALFVTVVSIAGAVAAIVVSASISLLQSDPSLTGQGGSGRTIDSGESVEVFDRAMPLLDNDDRVQMLAGIHVVFGISSPGADQLTALAYDVKRGDLDASVVRGRIAQQPDEVAVGPATLDRLGKSVGDTIHLRTENGAADFRIVGVTLFPEGDFEHDEGLALTSGGADRLVGNVHDAGGLHLVAFDWAQGVDTRAADAELAAAGLDALTAESAVKPASVTNLDQVHALPRFLAALLGVLAVVTIGYALAASMRPRTREFGTLRALGMTRRSTGRIIESHAVTIIALGIAAGVPLGLLLGTQTWRPIANHAHVVVRTETPWPIIALYIAALVVAAALLVAPTVWRARRLRPADALRDQ